jgi:hypothetical protein
MGRHCTKVGAWCGLALLAFVGGPGCAEVGEPPVAAGNNGSLDAGPIDDPDEPPPIDAGPVPVTLSHSDSFDVAPQVSVACAQLETDENGNTFPAFHRDNSYYRVFDLAAEGVEGDLAIEEVAFGIERADAGAAATQIVAVKLHSLEGAFRQDNLTELASVELDLADQAATVLAVPIEALAPVGSTLVVEIFAADGSPDRLFFLGANSEGQSAASYLRAPNCDDDGDPDNGSRLAEPLDLAAIGFGNVHAVISVSGVY